MTKEIEFNLSEKIDYEIACVGNDGKERGWILEDDVKEFIKIIEDWCWENNTIPLKDSNLRLAITDGGWVNVLELLKFIKEKVGEKLK